MGACLLVFVVTCVRSLIHLCCRDMMGAVSMDSGKEDEEQARRQEILWAVFHLFDLDDDSTIGSQELLQLGHARRKLGQTKSSWDNAKNDALVAKLGGARSGKVSGEKFVEHFGSMLSGLRTKEFDDTVKQFRRVACECQLAIEEEDEEDEEEEVDLEAERRQESLWAVFHLFDLDDNSTIESSEMMQLGEARRKLGQVSGTWDKAKNAQLMEKLGGGRSGQVSGEMFVEHFELALRVLKGEDFDRTIKEFRAVARACQEDY